MTIVKTENLSTEALAIVQKYEEFVNYLYPVLQTCPRKHARLRDEVLTTMFAPVGGLYRAARSKQPARLHDVDADFASLRFYLRFLASEKLKIITPHQQRAALVLLAHCGRMLGSWLGKLKGQAGKL